MREDTKELMLCVLREFDSPVMVVEKIKIETKSDHSLTLRFPNKFLADYFRDFYLERLKEKLIALSEDAIIIRLDYAENKSSEPKIGPAQPQEKESAMRAVLPTHVPSPASYTITVRPEFTFKNFAVGQSNEIAYGATVNMT